MMINKFKITMHQRPTYESVVKDTILEPKDKIALPDRRATQLRKMQQLNMFDDAEFIDLEDLQEKITTERIQSETFRKTGGGNDGTHHAGTAFQHPPPPPDTRFQPPPPPPSSAPRFDSSSGSAETGTQPGGKPPPPPPGGSIKRRIRGKQPPPPKPEQFDLTIDDDMDDDNDEYKQAIAVHERVPEERRKMWSQVIPNHLGPDAGTANPTFVSRLVELQGRRGRSYSPRRTETYIPKVEKDEEMLPVFDTTGAPPPPPGGGTSSTIPKLKGVRSKSVKERRGLVAKQKDPMEIDAEMNNGKPPPPPPPPPVAVFKMPRSRTPQRGRPKKGIADLPPAEAKVAEEKGIQIPAARSRSRSKSKKPEEVKIVAPVAPKQIDTTPKEEITDGLPTKVKKARPSSAPKPKPKPSTAPAQKRALSLDARPSAAPKAKAKPSKAVLYQEEGAPEHFSKPQKSETSVASVKKLALKDKVTSSSSSQAATKKPPPPSRVTATMARQIVKQAIADGKVTKEEGEELNKIISELDEGATRKRMAEINAQIKTFYGKIIKRAVK